MRETIFENEGNRISIHTAQRWAVTAWLVKAGFMFINRHWSVTHFFEAFGLIKIFRDMDIPVIAIARFLGVSGSAVSMMFKRGAGLYHKIAVPFH